MKIKRKLLSSRGRRRPSGRRLAKWCAVVVAGVTAFGLLVTPPTSVQGIAQGDGLLVYGEGTDATPRVRTFASDAFGSEQSAAAATANVRHTVSEAAPTRNEFLVGTQSTTGVLNIQRWNGASWSAEWNVTVGDSPVPRFDIAYEQSSGDAMVIYSGNVATTNELRYRTWNGTSWSSEQNLDPIRTSGVISAVRAESDGGTDNIAIAYADTDTATTAIKLSANYWSGSSWVGEPATSLETDLSTVGTGTATVTTTQSFDLAFESTSGELLIVWGKESDVDGWWVTRGAGGGGAWGTITETTAFNEEITDVDIAADPNSNDIALVNATDNGLDAEAVTWTGAGWGTPNNFDTGIDTLATGTKNVSIAWVRSGTDDRAVATYDDSNNGGIDWLYYTKSTTTWSLGSDYTGAPAAAGTDDAMHRMEPNPYDPSQAMMVVIDAGSDLFTKKITLSGGTLTWSSLEPGGATPEGSVSSITGLTADFSYNKYLPPPIFEQSGYRWYENMDGAVSGRISTNLYSSGVEKPDEVRLDTTGGYAYIFGTEGSSSTAEAWRIEKRSLSNAATIYGIKIDNGPSNTGSEEAQDFEIDVANGYMYLVGEDPGSGGTQAGQWRIEKRNLSDGSLVGSFGVSGAVKNNISANNNDTAMAIEIDPANNAMYIGGTDGSFGSTNGQARIEKRTLDTGALVGGFTTYLRNFTTNNDSVPALNFDSSTGDVYAIEDSAAAANDLYITKLNPTNGSAVYTVAFDNSGTSTSTPVELLADANHVYPVFNTVDGLQIDKRKKTDGSLETGFGASGILLYPFTASDEDIQNAAIDTQNGYMYLVGDAEPPVGSINYYLSLKIATSDGSISFSVPDLGTGSNGDLNHAVAVDGAAGFFYSASDYQTAQDTEEWTFRKQSTAGGAMASFTTLNPLAASNTVATAPANGTPFRLRALLHLSGNDLAQSGQSFKLQYAGKGAGTCTAPSGTPSSYTDISASTVIRPYDNAGLADATALGSHSSDPTHSSDTIVPQTYVEGLTFSNTSSVTLGQDALWDFSLVTASPPSGATYCLRIVKSDGTALTTYTHYPEITTAQPTLTLNASSGVYGNAVTFDGTDYTPSSTVTISWLGSDTGVTASPQTTADGSGNFSSFQYTPNITMDHYIIVAGDGTNESNDESYNLAASLSLSSNTGPSGVPITLTGSGYSPSSTVTVYYDGVATGTTTTANGSGQISVSFTPNGTAGSHTIKAKDSVTEVLSSRFSETKTFTVYPRISFTPTNGLSGASTTIAGEGFAASSTVTVIFDGSVTGTTTTSNSTGSFSGLSYQVTGTAGAHTIAGRDAALNISDNVTYTIDNPSALSVDIVDASGNPVSSPTYGMTTIFQDTGPQNASGTLGTSSQRIRITNPTGTGSWRADIAASGGPTSLWTATGQNYDFNDSSGGSDGGDADSYGGQMTINATAGTITPQSGCSAANITKGSSTAFSQGTQDNITLLTAASNAPTNCYFELTGASLLELVPREQAIQNYGINMTLTITAI